MSSMQTCLEELGVKESLLSDEQLELLDEKGYLILPAALDPASIDALRVRALLRNERDKKEMRPGFRSAKRPVRTGSPTLWTRTRCSTGAGRTRRNWPQSLTSLPAATSSCTRSTGALPTRATGCKRSTQTGMRLSKLVTTKSVTPSGCWTV